MTPSHALGSNKRAEIPYRLCIGTMLTRGTRGIPPRVIRLVDWKLVERYEDRGVYLYDLKIYIGELNDLAFSQPSRVQAMYQQFHAWYREMDAEFLQSKDRWRPKG